MTRVENMSSFYNTSAILKVSQMNKNCEGSSSFLTLEDPHLIGTDEQPNAPKQHIKIQKSNNSIKHKTLKTSFLKTSRN